MATKFELVRITDIRLFEAKPPHAVMQAQGIHIMETEMFSTWGQYGTCTVVVTDAALRHGGEDGEGLDLAGTLENWGMELPRPEEESVGTVVEPLPYHATE